MPDFVKLASTVDASKVKFFVPKLFVKKKDVPSLKSVALSVDAVRLDGVAPSVITASKADNLNSVP